MIVKTGANYQNDGGYIEASKKGAIYTLTDDDKSVSFGGSEELGPFIVPVTIINETDRGISLICLFKMADIENVLGMPTSYVVGAGETVTIKCVGIIGLPQRLTYSGSGVDLKCDSEYITVTNRGVAAVFTIVNIPENGDPITARLYI